MPREPRWLVKCCGVIYPGKFTQKTIPVFAHCNEWEAQGIASKKFQATAAYVANPALDHSISFKAKRCRHGDCDLHAPINAVLAERSKASGAKHWKDFLKE